MLKQRVITALIMAAGLLAAIFLLPLIYFVGLIAVIVLLAAWEWSQLIVRRGAARITYSAAVAVGMALLGWWLGLDSTGHFSRPEGVWIICVIAAGWWLLAIYLIAVYPRKTWWARKPLQAVIGGLVLLPAWLGLAYLRAEPRGEWLLIIMIVGVVCADTGAYFVGRRFGRRKLAPQVSPGKSWAGFYGGFVCSAVYGTALVLAIGPAVANFRLLAIIVLASLASVYGDLLESMVKRERGIKDSGTLLPGHGGILDRVDSISAAAPVFTLVYVLSGWQL